jgi:hypothetical protein
MSSRSKIPRATEVRVLVANYHTCCICRRQHLHVQLHHIDGDNRNSADSNLAVVCLNDHSRVTGDEGLGRHFSEDEVREYKRQWEEHCAGVNDNSNAEDDTDPVDTGHAQERIRADEHSIREFTLDSAQQLVVTIASDEYLQTYVCDPRDYAQFERTGKMPAYYDCGEDMLECELFLEAPRDATYCLVLINEEDDDAHVELDWAVWDA